MNIYTFNLLFFLPLSVTFYFELSRKMCNNQQSTFNGKFKKSSL